MCKKIFFGEPNFYYTVRRTVKKQKLVLLHLKNEKRYQNSKKGFEFINNCTYTVKKLKNVKSNIWITKDIRKIPTVLNSKGPQAMVCEFFTKNKRTFIFVGVGRQRITKSVPFPIIIRTWGLMFNIIIVKYRSDLADY